MKSQVSQKIRSHALDLGFSHVGISPADPLLREGERLREWLARGYHGTMDWMERRVEKRSDPREVLPGARSIIVTAMNYYVPVRHSQEAAIGKISRYAWGDDYHDVVRERLELLLSFIQSCISDVHAKIYVDTGPVMEKALAQRAGIGWIGKHTNLITHDHGSWVFLGEILLDVELEYDHADIDHCGSCTLCIEACPTDAIVEPYVLDSNLCISYLTIEHRGEIEDKLGEKFDRWIYGCDICQDVCPWNHKFSKPSKEEGFSPRQHNVAPNLAEWKNMNEEDFRDKFRESPMKRTKHSGLKRNIEISLVGESQGQL